MQVLLKVLHRNSNVEEIKLLASTVIGRSMECDVRLASSHVSRTHCRIMIEDSLVSIEDLGSANGTFLNDMMIEPQVPAKIKSGDKITIGPAEFQVEYTAPLPAPGTVAIQCVNIETTQNPRDFHESLRQDNKEKSSHKPPPMGIPVNSAPPAVASPNRPQQPEKVNDVPIAEPVTDYYFTEPLANSSSLRLKPEPEKKGVIKSLFSALGLKPNSAASQQKVVEAPVQTESPNSETVSNTQSTALAGPSPLRTENVPCESAATQNSGQPESEEDKFQKFLRQL